MKANSPFYCQYNRGACFGSNMTRKWQIYNTYSGEIAISQREPECNSHYTRYTFSLHWMFFRDFVQ